MTNRSVSPKSLRALIVSGLLLAVATLGLTACSPNFYYFPQYTFANRPVPPSKLANRVMVGITINGSTAGSLQILDALRDIRTNVENTKPSYTISGYSSGYPDQIFNFPAEIRGYVYSNSDGSLQSINYGTEASGGSAAKFPTLSSSIAISPTFGHFYSAEPSIGQLVVADATTGITYQLNLPNVFEVGVNAGDTVVLAMVRNSNTVYRLVKLNANTPYPTATAAETAIGATDCQPFNIPVYCVVPVNTTSNGTAHPFDHPSNVYFSLDGTQAYVLNCGAECGGTTSSITFLQTGALDVNTIPTAIPDTSAYAQNVPVPGGVTTALSDGTTLYVAGQQLQADGLFTGFLSTINLASVATSPSTAVTGSYSISDGTHTKMLFADDSTLWIGSQLCSNGERAKLGLNYNCLTRVVLPASAGGALSASVVPNVTPGSATAVVPYPNTNQNEYYYGDLTGLCWVQNLHKVYTAYGGQVHAFNTADGSEINNQYITIQGTALDVAYMDAITDAAN